MAHCFDFIKNYLISLIIVFSVNCNAKTYKNYTLEQSKVCSYDSSIPYSLPNELKVGLDFHSAILVNETEYFNNWTGIAEFKCTFSVRSEFSDHGIFAVIQKMSLRKDPITGSCLDYVKFRHSKVWGLEKAVRLKLHPLSEDWTVSFCGNETVNSSLMPFGFKDPKGNIDVKIFIAKKKLEQGDAPLALQLAFTSYKVCKYDIGAYKFCGNNTCIYKNYFKDSILNCLSVNCPDEEGCYGVVSQTNKETVSPTSITITGVGSVFMSFFLFLGLACLCHYCDCCFLAKLCGVTSNASRQPTTNNATVYNGQLCVELEDNVGQLNGESEPTTTNVPSKDLPPAYETLFPES